MNEAADPLPRILVADDSKVMRMSTRKILDAEFDLVVEADGQAAWDRLEKDPDILVLFTDVGMPELDGYELLARIRQSKEPRLRELPVIVVTGNDEESAREKALELGATDFITKPFDRAQLLARARAYATQDRMRRRASELEESNTLDALTGLGNSRYFEQRLREIRAWGLRHELPMAVLRMDLLDFDAMVQQRGKRVALDVLKDTAALLRKSLREEDVITRLGGGRFAVVCGDCDREGTQVLTERVMASVANTAFAGEHAVRVDAAMGAYLPGSDPKEGVEAIYKAAQAALKGADPGKIVLHPAVKEKKKDPLAAMEETLYGRLSTMLARLPKASALRLLDRLRASVEG